MFDFEFLPVVAVFFPFLVFALLVAFFLGRRDGRLRLTVLDHIAILVRRGLPLGPGLASLADERGKSWGRRARKEKKILQDLAVRVDQGSLGDALAAHGDVFPWATIALIRAAEQRNAIAEVASVLVREEQERDDFTSRLVERAFYPLLLIGLVTGVASFLSIFIVPKYVEIFESMGIPNDQAARADRAGLVTGGLVVLTGATIGVVFLVVLDWLPQLARTLAWRAASLIPAVGRPVRKLLHARWLSRVGALLAAGASLPDALDDASRLPGMGRRLGEAARLAREGRSVHDLIPLLLGREAGELGALLRVDARAKGPGPAFLAMAEWLDRQALRRLDAYGQMARAIPVALAGLAVFLHLSIVWGAIVTLQGYVIRSFTP